MVESSSSISWRRSAGAFAPRGRVALLASMAAALAAVPVLARESTDISGTTLESVVVTAQRRTENLQDVPISVTTLSTSELEASGAVALEDLTVASPGLVMTRQLRGSTPFLRGVGATSVTPGNESPVAQYVDGVYFMSPLGNIFSFNNIERIEVLKGPQGTLFGRNATGGLINVITREPTATPEFKVGVSYGDYETVSGSLYAGGGFDEVAADIAVYYIDQGEGYGRNLNTGADVNYQNEKAVRGKVVWTPTDKDKFVVAADWSENTGDIGLTRSAYPGSRLFGGVTLQGTPFDTQSVFPTYIESFPAWGVSLKYQRTFDWGQFQSLTSFRDQKDHLFLDQDATPTPFVNVEIHEANRWQQQEFLLIGDMNRLSWTTGVFLFGATSEYEHLAITSGVVPSLNADLIPRQETESYAAFAQGTYAVTDSTNVTAGLRYTVDNRTFSTRQIALPGHPAGAGVVLGTKFDDASFPKLTWRFAVDQQLGDDVLVYLSYDRGFKSGIFNTGILNANPVDPETLDALELGLKSEWFDRTVRLNAAVFGYKYEDIQLQRVVTGASVIFNAAEGELFGLDLEATYAPRLASGDLQLNLGASLLDTEYTSFPDGPTSIPNSPPAGGNATLARDLTGNTMIRAPEWTVSVGFDYQLPIGDTTLGIGANYYKSDDFFWEPDNRLKQDSYDVLNAYLSLAFGGDQRWRVRLFGKNLTDSVYGSYVSAGAVGDLVAAAPPRTYGIGFDFEY